MSQLSPPDTESELVNRVAGLSGMTLGELARKIDWPIPKDLKRDKGWIGQLLEVHLGASAGNLSEPDFQLLGIELKTLPLNKNQQAKETTYVCTVPLLGHIGLQWQQSCVYRKLSRVLWLPIEADPDIALAQRRVGHGFIWSPNAQDFDIIRQDWEEFMELICLGQVDSITAHQGEYLQIRPKAANASVVTQGIGPDGRIQDTLPRGFYLRTLFTNQILKHIF